MIATTSHNTDMMVHLWNYLKCLPMSSWDQRWLADRLLESSMEKHPAPRGLEFPRLPKDFKLSSEVMSLSCGPLPEGFDVDKELERMREERAL